ncbi:PhnA protein [Taibaiella sp. KBW10]|uniref:PhnA domain-containing protein n=1 Tax=Taibaiella sp. KBW10 TaxID=2153357 RepID=UPI000F5AB605|nr:alkylphosphonate utilization protein [Taibaiella sp. KBW10]RQO32047.1 PhnA protein [Taibaiella sp. KBW10]
MNLQQLQERSHNQCELCDAKGGLSIYEVPPTAGNVSDREIYICEPCLTQVDKKAELTPAHWQQCLGTAMWNEAPAVQVVAWRMLNRFRQESWAADLLDMMYLDEEHMEWAKATGDHESDGSVDLHRDSNGHQLENGDSVVLIKSLDVKGSTVNASLGTVVKNIKLDPNDTAYVEGKIEGQSIMIKTIFVRKQGAQIIT